MEDSVVNSSLGSNIGEIFDPGLSITSQSGSGNNWATGFCEYGSQYREAIYDSLRNAAEKCDAMGSWFLIHSMGGGTGSGLGTNILQILRDEFPRTERLVTSVYPSKDDDVITSPYNTVLAMQQLTDNADSVIPVDNCSLAAIVDRVRAASGRNKITQNDQVSY